MFSTTEAISDIIKATPYIEEALAEDLINYSSLARKIHTQVEKKLMKAIKEGAIIMALKRASSRLRKTAPKSEDILKNLGDLLIRSDLVDYTFVSSPTLSAAQDTLLKKTEGRRDIFITISHGVSQVTIIASQALENDIKEIFKGENSICEIENLSSLTIRISELATKTPGVLYSILKILAWEGISITECVSTYTELSIILDRKDIERAFSLLNSYTKNQS